MVDTRTVVSVQITIKYFRKQHLWYRQSIGQGVSGTKGHTDIDISIGTVGWVDGWVDGWMGGQKDRRTDREGRTDTYTRTDGHRRTNGRTGDRQTDGRADSRKDGLMDGWTDGWMDGWMDRQTDRHTIHTNFDENLLHQYLIRRGTHTHKQTHKHIRRDTHTQTNTHTHGTITLLSLNSLKTKHEIKLFHTTAWPYVARLLLRFWVLRLVF
jgi:hypothetical protein